MGMNKKSWEPTNYQKDRLISSTNKVHHKKYPLFKENLNVLMNLFLTLLNDIQKDCDPNSYKLKLENLQKGKL